MQEQSPSQIQKTPIERIQLIPNLPVIYKPEDIEEYLGYVSGISIQGISIGKEFLAGIKDITGGRIKRYEEAHKLAEDQALMEMLTESYNLGANAVINFNIDNEVGVNNTAHVKASGVAVKLKEA